MVRAVLERRYRFRVRLRKKQICVRTFFPVARSECCCPGFYRLFGAFVREIEMKVSVLSRLAAVIVVGALIAGCANTIRGVGRDTANAVDATQNAGRNISRAAE